jgi:hypothetical protein
VTPLTPAHGSGREAGERGDQARAAHAGRVRRPGVLFMSNMPLDVNVQFLTIMATKMPFVGRG